MQRNIRFHFRDLNEKAITKGELDNICRVIPPDKLIDRESKQYKKRGMRFMKFDIEEELIHDWQLLKTPIVRNGRLVSIGYRPEIWKEWIENE